MFCSCQLQQQLSTPSMFRVAAGCPAPLGPSVLSSQQHPDGKVRQTVNIAVRSRRNDLILCLFNPLQQGQQPIRDVSKQLSFPGSTENVHHIRLENVERDTAYAICVSVSCGERRLLTDPYAPCVESLGAAHWMCVPGESAHCSGDGDVRRFISSFSTLRRLRVQYPFRPARFDQPLESASFDWEDDVSPHVPYERLVVYEAHARALSPDGTLEGAAERAAYLKWLGITAVQLLPVFEFAEIERGAINGEYSLRQKSGSSRLPPLKRPGNWWGYSPLSWFAPMNRYSQRFACGGPVALKYFVKALHRHGIECFLDVVYNHTSNSSCALHYLDVQKDYFLRDYQQSSSAKSFKHSNISACGNTLSPNCAETAELIVRSLQHFVREYHIDGFRFDMAGVLCRDVDGKPMMEPPVIHRIVEDDVLKNVKCIVEGWDAGDQIGSPNMLLGSKNGFPYGRRFMEWNPEWRDVVRTFVGGKLRNVQVSAFRSALSGSPHLFKHDSYMPSCERPLGSNHSLNFVACHDGFCLADVVSFCKRVNTDGYDEISFNCGVEGSTTDERINKMRARQLRNFIFILAISRGAPMITQGDEIGFSKSGNSNTWNDPGKFMCSLPDDPVKCKAQEVLVQFTRYMLKIRREHPQLGGSDFFKDITWLDSFGNPLDLELSTDKEGHSHITMEPVTEVVSANENADDGKMNITEKGKVIKEGDGSNAEKEHGNGIVKGEGRCHDKHIVGYNSSDVVDEDSDDDDGEIINVIAFVAPSLQTLSAKSMPNVVKLIFVAFNRGEEEEVVNLPRIEVTSHKVKWVAEVDTFSSKWRQDPRYQWDSETSIAIRPHSAILFTAKIMSQSQ